MSDATSLADTIHRRALENATAARTEGRLTPARCEALLVQIDVLLSRGLRSIDQAAAFAEILVGTSPDAFAQRSIDRARQAREALIEIAGISLPALRIAPDQEEAPIDMTKDSWTVADIAKAAGVVRSTVIRWIRSAGGGIAETYDGAIHQGERARFTLDEARMLLESSGKVRGAK